jgi:hypothetical protein
MFSFQIEKTNKSKHKSTTNNINNTNIKSWYIFYFIKQMIPKRRKKDENTRRRKMYEANEIRIG